MKKQLSLVSLTALIGAFVFSLEGCGDDPNPCKGLKQTSADFTIMEDISYLRDLNPYWPYYACDTVIIKQIRFTAVDSTAATYEWHIGAGVYTKRKFVLNFFNATETVIPIT